MPPDAPVAAVLPARRALAPRYWAAHVFVVLALVACVLLGRWQLGVWQGHRAANAAAVTRQSAVALDAVLGPDAAFPASGVGRPVVVEGHWDPAHTVYVSGQPRGSRTGVWAVTPVITATGSAIPVVRGWAPRPAASPVPPRGAAELVGLLQPSDDSGTNDPNTHDDVIPVLSINALLPRASYDLYDGYVVATGRSLPSGAAPATGMQGLLPVTAGHLPGADAGTALRNLLYAFQWWIFGAFAVFVWWRWLQEDVLGRRRSPPSG